MVLFGSEAVIRQNVAKTLGAAGGSHHILNVGHGVVQVQTWLCAPCNMDANGEHRGCWHACIGHIERVFSGGS